MNPGANRPNQDRVGALRHAARIAARAGRTPEAIRHLLQACALDPGSATLQCELGRLLASHNDFHAAVKCFHSAVDLAPEWLDGWFFLGITLPRVQRHYDGLEALRRAYELAPDREEVLRHLAELEFLFGQPIDALPLWQALHEMHPADALVSMRLGEVHSRLGRPQDAIVVFEAALAAEPESADLRMALAQAKDDSGDREGAAADYLHALDLRPNWVFPMSGLLGIRGDSTPAGFVHRATERMNAPDAADSDIALLGYELGKIHDRRGLYAAAMDCWKLANAARRRQIGPLDRVALLNKIESVTAIGRQSGDVTGEKNAMPRPTPVFIVGMPRSGTTLTEQLIAMHPQAVGCGEPPDLAIIANRLLAEGRDPEEPSAYFPCDEARIRSEASRYLKAVMHHARPQTRYLVDKAPLNFLNLWLAALLFPECKVIWCHRDPRDLAVSIYAENFSLDARFATDLRDIGFFIKQEHKLRQFCGDAMPTSILPVAYENLVANFESHAREIIDFLELPWHPACLDFHTSNSGVQTPSRWQVKEPVHNRSVGRWRNYADMLQPLMDELAF